MNYTKIIDISLPLNTDTIIYPNNAPLSITTAPSPSGSILSTITMGSHSGTHIDAPFHADVNWPTLEQIPLNHFIGPCRVLDCTTVEKCVQVADLAPHNIQPGERILLKTKNSLRGLTTFYDDYTYLDGAAAAYLAERQVALVAIDYLSIKQRGSKDNSPHTNLLSKNIPIVEGVVLSAVAPGNYELVVLPLAFTGLDGAPARAVLLQ